MYFTCEWVECQGNLFKSLFMTVQYLFTLAKCTILHPLTKIFLRDKMTPHAGMVELVDSVDLGAVTSVKVFSSIPLAKIKAGSPVFIYCG